MADLNNSPREIPGLISDRHKLRREGPIDAFKSAQTPWNHQRENKSSG